MNQMEDSIFEALFRQAVIDSYNAEIDSIPPRDKLVGLITPSPEFELRMKRLFAHEQRKAFFVRALSYSRRVAVVFIVITDILFSILLFNTEVRAAVKNTVVEWYDKFTSFIFRNETVDIDEIKEWRPKYLPEGYHENSVEKLGKATSIEYVNGAGDRIYVSYRPERNGTCIFVDNENHLIESETINGYEAYIAKATNDDFESGIIWSMKGYTFSIWSRLSADDLVKIAQSIEQ